jgi:hypothetical protein
VETLDGVESNDVLELNAETEDFSSDPEEDLPVDE